jgi:bacillithiol biosynthesis cysteine-adding enzyme BshC
VFSNTAVSGTTTRIPIDIRRFPWVKRLLGDYVGEYARLGDFFAGDPANAKSWRQAIERTQRHPRNRNLVCDVVQAQQRQRGAPPEAVAATTRLRDPESVAIVTGQQAGLFGGPQFTLLKAVTAIWLAEQVSNEHQVPAVAVFWIDAEDHDWDEVKSCGVLNGDLDLKEVALGSLPGAGHGPVARLRLDHSAVAALADLRAALPQTEFSAGVFRQLESAYRPGRGMVEAFGAWLESVLGSRGLIVFDSSDTAAKPLLAPLFVRELEHAGRTAQLAAAAGRDLVTRGYHAQVTPQEDHAALFRLDGARVAIETREAPALVERARTSPSEFSPSVLLRPVAQDTLFPTVCYVAGPNELAYLAQLRGVYEAFDTPMPLIYHRASATIVDSNAMRFLARHELPLESLRARDEAALNQLIEAQIPPAVHVAFDEATRVTTEQMDVLARSVAQVDATLEGAVRSAAGRMQDDLKKLHGKIVQGIKRKDETLRRQFQHAQAQAFPGGHSQERAVGFVYFLNRYGDLLVERLLGDVPFDQKTHWLLTL